MKERKFIDLVPLFASAALRRVAVTLLGLFSPLYILQRSQEVGFSLNFSIVTVIFFFAVLYLFKLLVLPLVENLGLKIGFKSVLAYSSFPFVFFLAFLFLSQVNYLFLLLAAIFWGIHAGFFWWGYHGAFVKTADQDYFGRETGAVQVLLAAAAVIAPILGGFIVYQIGYQFLFIFAGVIFLLAILVILPTPERVPKRDARIKKVWQIYKTHKRMVVAYIGRGGVSGLYGIIWPIFLFLVLGKILTFGEIVSAAILFASLINLLIGVRVDRVGSRATLAWGAPLNFLSWLARIFARSAGLIIIVDTFYRVTEKMLIIPLDVLSYRKAIEGGTGQALYFREISLTFGAMFFLFLAAVLVLLSLPLWTTFVLASIGALMPLLIVRK